MASKYAGLKGRIPEEEPTERAEDLKKALDDRKAKALTELTQEYNGLKLVAAKLAADVKANNVLLEALELLIRKAIDDSGADSAGFHGYTWAPKFEPYPVAEDPDAIVTYFKDNGLEDQLKLTATELAGRLKSYVKEEALANELTIEMKEIPAPDGNGTIEVTEVRSKIPGVRVFLKGGLSRSKSSTKGV